MPQTKNNKRKSKRTKAAKNGTTVKIVERLPGAPQFGPVSTISSAPVAIGNSIRGSTPSVRMSKDGCRVVGRDFAFAATATPSTVTGWTLVGGMPITPSAYPSSALKSYTQMYAKFKVNQIAFHYITSSSTSQTGDVLFYVERDRSGPCMDWTNNSFLPFTLSDTHTVLGPQWTNHTATYSPAPEFHYTDYGVNPDLNADIDGQVMLFSKTSSASSPGYVIVDYDITFRELQVNPRAGLLPVARAQFSPVNMSRTAAAVTAGSTAATCFINAGNAINGVAAAAPSGAVPGDIYRLILDVTNSAIVNAAWTNVTTANLLNYELPGGNDSAVTIDDGFTCFGVCISSTEFRLFPTLPSALGSGNGFTFGVTATITFNLCAMASLVFNLNSNQQSSY